MTYRVYSIILACSLIGGFLYYAIDRQLIIIRTATSYPERAEEKAEKKKVTLYYFQHEKWHSEVTELMFPFDKAQAIKYVIDNWLTLLDEEKIMEKKVTLQSALLSPTELEIFLSFDRNPFAKESTAYEKLMWVEGLLKTLRENGIKIQKLRFLVHHQPLHDYHLDFSQPWPLMGFQTK